MLNEKYRKLHKELGIPADYGRDGYPSYYLETTTLVEVGPNLLGRPQYLREDAAGHWFNLVKAALSDGIELLMVSGFRNIEYQADLIRRKLEAGQEISQILGLMLHRGLVNITRVARLILRHLELDR